MMLLIFATNFNIGFVYNENFEVLRQEIENGEIKNLQELKD
jgi:hypothetical protein